MAVSRLRSQTTPEQPTLSRDPTYLGTIAAVAGAALNVHLARSVASGLWDTAATKLDAFTTA